jgi:2-oxoisovalerate dehydrogenase E1 component
MTTSFTTPASTERLKAARAAGLEPEVLIKAFRLMQTSRQLDDREIMLKRQQRIFFQISGAGPRSHSDRRGSGHPARLRLVLSLLSRPRALPDARYDALDMLLQAVGAADDPSSGGRQMPSHWSDPAKNIVASSSATGTQFVQAVGCAEGCRILYPGEDRLVLASSGEGATSEGEFWESINQACLNRSPVLFLIEDNGWAISVPVESPDAGRIDFESCSAGFPIC